MKKGSKNDVKIDAKTRKGRHWAAKGRPNVGFDSFLDGFGRMPKKYEFLGTPKINQNAQSIPTRAPRRRMGEGGFEMCPDPVVPII